MASYELRDFDYDFEPAGLPRRFYALCTTHRSGSTFLGSLLWATGAMGAPREYFNIHGEMFRLQGILRCRGIAEYTDEILRRRTSQNGVFGMKLHYPHMSIFRQCGRLHLFRGMKYVHLRRRDRIAQAVSYALATQTEQWSALEPRKRVPQYKFSQIRQLLERTNQQEDRWESLFRRNNIKPFELAYEDLCLDADRYIAEICRFVGVEANESAPSVPVPQPIRQASSLNAEWISRFKADYERWTAAEISNGVAASQAGRSEDLA